MSLINTYEPSEQVKWFHDRSRWNRHFDRVTNSFPSDFSGTNENEPWVQWAEGCAMWAAIFISFGIALFVIHSIGYFVSCCCCRPEKNKSKSYSNHNDWSASSNERVEKETHYGRKTYIAFLVAGIVFFIMAGVTFYPVTRVHDAWQNGINSIQTARDIVSNLRRGTTYVSNVTMSAVYSTQQLQSDLRNEGETELADDLQPIIDETLGAQGSISDAFDGTGTVIKSLDNIISKSDRNGNKYANHVGYTYAGIMMACTLILILTALPFGCNVYLFKFVGVPLNVLFLLFLWFICGAYFFIGIAFSDYCMDPNGNALDVASHNMDTQGSVYLSYKYYLECNSTDDHLNPTGIYVDVQNGLSTLHNTTAFLISNLYQEIQNGNVSDNATVLSTLHTVNNTLNVGIAETSHLLGTISCSNIRQPWEQTVSAVCNDLISDGFIVLWAISFVLCMMLTFMLILGWKLCTRHPGREREKRPYSEQLEFLPVGNQPSTSAFNPVAPSGREERISLMNSNNTNANRSNQVAYV